MNKFIIYLSFIFFINISIASEINYLEDIDTFNSDGTINVVVEIQAGSNVKNALTNDGLAIEKEFSSNKERVINYLPYPFNYGILPQTLESFRKNGDGDPLDVILIGHSIKEKTIIKAKVIGIIHMLDQQEKDNKILATTFDATFEKINSIDDLNENYEGIIEIIKIWLLNYKGGYVEIQKIEKKNKALEYIKISKEEYIIERNKDGN